jgi:hypothetical protein
MAGSIFVRSKNGDQLGPVPQKAQIEVRFRGGGHEMTSRLLHHI